MLSYVFPGLPVDVADSFNPYRDWLGLADGQRPPTYYGLFGLKPLESDADRIRKAILRLAAKIRGIHPGSHMLEWQQIIDEISAAKACLTDPAAKAAYDARLGGTASRQKLSPQVSTRSSPDTAVPPMATPPSATSDASARRTPTSDAVSQPARTEIKRQSPRERAIPRSAGQPPAASIPAPGNAPAPIPPPVAGPPPASIPVPESVPTPIPPPVAGPPPPPGDGSYDYAAFSQGYALPQPGHPGQAGAQGYPPPYASQGGVPIAIAQRSTIRRSRRRNSTRTGPAIVFVLFVIVGLLGAVAYQLVGKDLFTASARPAKIGKAAEKRPQPKDDDADLSQSATASRILPQDSASLQQDLADVVRSLGKRDIAGAQAILSRARSKARSPEDQKTLEKHAKLCDEVGQFWRAIGERVSKFRPAEEVTLGKTRIVVVEAGGGRFSFKVGNKVRVCTAETIPSWLAIALAEGNLGGDGPSKETYGAFLAVDPEGDRSRARALWSESKIEEALPPLDSLPPTAMP